MPPFSFLEHLPPPPKVAAAPTQVVTVAPPSWLTSESVEVGVQADLSLASPGSLDAPRAASSVPVDSSTQTAPFLVAHAVPAPSQRPPVVATTVAAGIQTAVETAEAAVAKASELSVTRPAHRLGAPLTPAVGDDETATPDSAHERRLKIAKAMLQGNAIERWQSVVSPLAPE